MSDDDCAVEHRDSAAAVGPWWRRLFLTEDQWAIWLGLAIIAVGLCVYLPNPPEGMDQTIRESNATMAAEPMDAKIREAHKRGAIAGTSQEELERAALEAGIITAAEHAHLRRTARLRHEVIRVDDFPQDFGRAELEQAASQSAAQEAALKAAHKAAA